MAPTPENEYDPCIKCGDSGMIWSPALNNWIVCECQDEEIEYVISDVHNISLVELPIFRTPSVTSCKHDGTPHPPENCWLCAVYNTRAQQVAVPELYDTIISEIPEHNPMPFEEVVDGIIVFLAHQDWTKVVRILNLEKKEEDNDDTHH